VISTAIIIPTLNERANIPEIIDRLERLLPRSGWEIIFVDDDSQDGSVELLLSVARQKSYVRLIRRLGRRGLASACLEGMASTAAELFAVMDADLQHDEAILPQMLAAFDEDPDLDLAVGSRYTGSGGVGEWSRRRAWISRLATGMATVTGTSALTDPMSGFFVIRREVFEATVRRMTGKGFKILLDLVSSSPRPLRIREFAYQFRPREHGESKLDAVVALEYLYLLADKLVGRFLPVRFLMYVTVGLTGLLLHVLVLGWLHRIVGMGFTKAQIIATLGAMVSNFIVNNSITFRQQRLVGKALLPGLLGYVAICGLGAIANVQTASYLHAQTIPWWFAGIVGAVVGAVWNYAVSTHIVWTWLPNVLLGGSHESRTGDS
jgi:dolichol-phosphate mannosyltransferase